MNRPIRVKVYSLGEILNLVTHGRVQNALIADATRDLPEGTYNKTRVKVSGGRVFVAAYGPAKATEIRRVQVEYDRDYYGGDYDDAGDSLTVTVVEEPIWEKVEWAFMQATRLSTTHIVNWCEE